MQSAAARAIDSLLRATSSCTGPAFFQALAKSVAEVFGTRFGYVGELIAGQDRVRSLAFWDGIAFAPPVEYDLEGTPCSVAISGDHCHFPDGVQRRFPADTMLTDLGVRAYFGVPLRDPLGNRRGLIAALNDRPTPALPDFEAVLGVFAHRACAELDRRDAEQAVRQSENLYRRIVTTCSEGIWLIDSEARTTLVNQQMAAMLGYQESEMLGRSVFDFVDMSSHEHTRHNVERRKQGLSERHVSRLRCKDGSLLEVLMSTSPLPDNAGGYSGALAMVTDLTERRGLEARVRDAERMESLGLLAGGVAHDFNNLLVGILGRADLALARAERDAAQNALLLGIRDAAERAADLTRQLLAYAGKASLVPEAIDVHRAITDIVRLSGPALPKSVEVQVAPRTQDVFVFADRAALTQLLLNLLTNAAQSIGGNSGTVRISVRLETVARGELIGEPGRPLSEGAYVVLEVSDTGTGMSRATMARIFEPFFSTKGEGRGLGLAAVHGIVRAHGGAICVDSELGKGTTFTLHLPATSERPVERKAAEVSPPEVKSKPVILVVDDEAAVREVARVALESLDYRVDVFGDGQQALDRFRAEPTRYAAALLDVTMPKLGGIELARQMGELRPDLPVILMSGYAEQSVPDGAHAAFLQKPFRIGVLRDTLARVLA